MTIIMFRDWNALKASRFSRSGCGCTEHSIYITVGDRDDHVRKTLEAFVENWIHRLLHSKGDVELEVAGVVGGWGDFRAH